MPYDDPAPADQCGVFGVWAPADDVARLTYFGIYALQHRGQQSAGIASSNGESILVYKDLGLVSQVFNDQALEGLKGTHAIGHARYATTGADVWENAQPTLGPTAHGTLALAHNGNLTNTKALRRFLQDNSLVDGDMARGASTDTAVITALMGVSKQLADLGWEGQEVPEDAAPLVEAGLRVFPKLLGAFSLVFMDEHHLYAARDPHGVRPLVLGRLPAGWAVASETAALDIVGATMVREIEPGEFISIDQTGISSYRFAPASPHTCSFEYVYLARPDTRIGGKAIIQARREMGAELAREHPVVADIVMSTPDSGTPAAIGYAEESGIPYQQGMVKNSYVGRTFIQPTQLMRQRGIRLKLNPIREIIKGKRVVVVDDSIVRGNTQRQVVAMLREAGAVEVHVRISSPPVQWPCFYGIDFATRAELISSSMSVDEICKSIGADSLGYLSVNGMVNATSQQRSALCSACFTGDYPIEIPVGTPVPGGKGAVSGPARKVNND
ncbi:MAG: amidophosphoribosyltransferase [Actinomycetaceae bacterium]|nr:amidophosphoribosyltransferase [Actinomycetaceae bacterium]